MTSELPPFDYPLVVAHRGGALLRAENSASAFRFAITSGILALETDIQMSRDGTLFCWHDDDLTRIGHPKITLWDSEAHWLSGLHLDALGVVDHPQEKLLSLEALLLMVGKKTVHLFLELKSPPPEARLGIREQLVSTFLALLDRHPCGVTVISFDTICLRMIRIKRPELPMVHLVDASGPNSSFPRWGCSLDESWDGTPDLVYTCRRDGDYRRAHQRGAKIWMCDHPLEARRWHP